MNGSEEFSVPDLAPLPAKLKMAAKENKFHALIKYYLDVRAPGDIMGDKRLH